VQVVVSYKVQLFNQPKEVKKALDYHYKDGELYSTPKCQYSFLKTLIPIHVMQPAMFFAPDF